MGCSERTFEKLPPDQNCDAGGGWKGRNFEGMPPNKSAAYEGTFLVKVCCNGMQWKDV